MATKQKSEGSQDLADQLRVALQEKRRAEDDAKMLRNLLREKDDELVYLQAFIMERSRLRFLIKELVIKFDSIVKVHLTKHTRNKKRYPAIELSVESEDPAEILTAVQAADKAVFTAKPSLLHRIEAIIFKGLLAAYTFIKRAIYRSLRFLVRSLRKIRG